MESSHLKAKVENGNDKPFNFLGMDYAPLNIPMERRLQTLGVVHIMVWWLLVPVACTTLFIGFLFSENYKWVSILYLTYMIYEKDVPSQGGRQNVCYRKFRVWKYMADYFPSKLIKTCELDPQKNYLMGYHPHGVFALGACMGICTDGLDWDKVFPGLLRRVVTLNVGFWIPGFREMAMMLGCVQSDKNSLRYCLNKPNFGATVLVVGGAQEALQGDDETIELTLNQRKGFIKLALECGTDLVPIIALGEQQIFKLARSPKGSTLRKIQEWAKGYLSFSPVIFFGRGIFQYSFGLLPYRKPVNVVVGSPVSVDKVDKPSQEQIDDLHSRYIESLKNLYDKYNPIYGDENIKLNIE